MKSWRAVIYFLMLVVAIDGTLMLFHWNDPARETYFVVAYVGVITLFLGAVVYGFIVSQSTYSDQIEEVKFSMLREELGQWSVKAPEC
jgi:hypothetical protein